MPLQEPNSHSVGSSEHVDASRNVLGVLVTVAGGSVLTKPPWSCSNAKVAANSSTLENARELSAFTNWPVMPPFKDDQIIVSLATFDAPLSRADFSFRL